MPYAFLNFEKFISDVSLQIQMNNNPYIFPYTLQYVGSLSYFYYLKNIFFWGLGPFISVLSILGCFLIIKDLLKINWTKIRSSKLEFRGPKLQLKIKNYNFQISNYLLFFTIFVYVFYFLIIGRSSVKFMRYILPLYPFLAILAGYGLLKIQNSKVKSQNYFIYFIIFSAVVWSLMFINIYSQKHTRIQATEWILKNISYGKTLAVEHWDDRLPLYGGENYNFAELTLYDQPDDDFKWRILNEKLKLTDYIIIASNRLYIPLQKLTDCQKFKVCYPKTAKYYKKLFNEELGFKKIAEFAVYPGIKVDSFEFKINDQTADESFTVYDHPKIMIFKKINY
jgi:hypothetical protein